MLVRRGILFVQTKDTYPILPRNTFHSAHSHNLCLRVLGPVYTTAEKASGWSRMLGQDTVI